MDNVFIQILIKEIENINLVYSQLTLANWKLGQFKNTHPNQDDYSEDLKKAYEALVGTGSVLIDELKISITQILIRMEAIKNNIRLKEEESKTYNELAAKIYDSPSPEDKDLIEFIKQTNEIYVNHLINPRVDNTRDTVKQLTGDGRNG